MEPSLHDLEEEQIVTLEQSLEDFYLWGQSFHSQSLEAVLVHMVYLKECILDTLCRIGELMTKHSKLPYPTSSLPLAR